MGNKPIINSYCAADRLYAGEYPGDKSADKAKEKLAAFCSFGITPEFYKKDLELHDVIIHVADDLYEGKVSKYH